MRVANSYKKVYNVNIYNVREYWAESFRDKRTLEIKVYGGM